MNDILNLPTVEEMIKAGVHCGHPVAELNPKMKPYLFTQSKGRHVIDLFYTLRLLKEAINFVSKIASNNGQFLIVGTNPQKAEFIAAYAQGSKCHYVTHKWLGGMLTNWTTVTQRLLILSYLEKQEKSGLLAQLPKKEASILSKKLLKLRKYLNGIKYMRQLPDAVIVIDQQQDYTAIQECRRLGIPVIGLVDTNGDPNVVDLPIPANDDSISAVRCILKPLLMGIQRSRLINK
jgi:small subunit ribosomal protein S2